MANNAPINQQKITARKRKRQFWLSFGAVVFILILLSCFSFISSLDFFQVKTINVSGGTSKEVWAAESAAEQALGGQSFFFFTRTDIFFVSASNIAKDIVNSISSIASVSVSKKYFSEIDIVLEEKAPSAVWCLDSACDSLDSSGIAFASAQIPPSSNLIIFANGNIPHIGAAPLPAEEFIPLLIFAGDLPQRGIYASNIGIVGASEADIYIGTSTKLIVDPTKDLSAPLGNLDRLLMSKDSVINIHNIFSLQYLDLRFPDKVFYK